MSRPIMNRAFSALDGWDARDPGLRPGLKMDQAFGLNTSSCPGRTNIPRLVSIFSPCRPLAGHMLTS
jgi:hypothetical protein